MKVLVIAPHHDDETFGAGGTLLKHKKTGDDIFWLVVTTSWDDISNQRVDRRQVQEKIAQAYGADVENLGFPDGSLDRVPFRTLLDAVKTKLEVIQPDIIYTVGPGDVHPDHDRMYSVVMGATRPSYWHGSRVLAMEIPSSTNWSYGEKASRFIPNIYVNISEFIEQKIDIAKMYYDEIFPYPHARSLEALRVLSMYRGSTIGVRNAEAFMLLREVIW